MKDESEVRRRLNALERQMHPDSETAISHFRYGQLMALAWVLEEPEGV